MSYILASLSMYTRTFLEWLIPSYNSIIPGIWIGDYHAALNESFLTTNRIDVIVNCTTDMPFTPEFHTIEKLRIPVEDSLLEKDFLLMEEYMETLVPLLVKYYLAKKNILVHCYRGKQRSTALVVAVLYMLMVFCNIELETGLVTDIPIVTDTMTMTEKKRLLYQIIQFVQQKRPQAFMYGFRVNFLKTLERYIYSN